METSFKILLGQEAVRLWVVWPKATTALNQPENSSPIFINCPRTLAAAPCFFKMPKFHKQTPKVNVSKDTQYMFFSWAQLIFRHQKTITHRLDGYLNRLETCSGAWGLDSLLSSSEGWEMTYCPWPSQGSLSSPGTLRKQTATVVMSYLLLLPMDTRYETPMSSLVLRLQRAVENINGKGRAGISTFSPEQKWGFLGGGQKEEQLCLSKGGAETAYVKIRLAP